ncbi:hypothetical protein ZWY2020_008473 [Hordeum vulgare]|nr:hypothetical protein ZWY2020_008473 [Hordeum vulgare]
MVPSKKATLKKKKETNGTVQLRSHDSSTGPMEFLTNQMAAYQLHYNAMLRDSMQPSISNSHPTNNMYTSLQGTIGASNYGLVIGDKHDFLHQSNPTSILNASMSQSSGHTIPMPPQTQEPHNTKWYNLSTLPFQVF